MFTKTISAIAVAGLLIVVARPSVSNATALNNDSASLPACCIKRAYCSQLQRECCPNRTREVSEATVDADDVVTTVSQPSCCVKRAYCCSIQRSCCSTLNAVAAK